MEGVLEEQKEETALEPLSIPTRQLDKAGISRYYVYGEDGQREMVEAFSAAEVMGKTSISPIAKIERETRQVMQSVPQERVLEPEEATSVETCISLQEENRPAFVTIDWKEEEAQEDGAGFEALSLGDLHAKEAVAEESPVEPSQAIEEETVEAQADVAEIEAPEQKGSSQVEDEVAVEAEAEAPPIPKERLEGTEEELAQDEIEALLKG